MAKIDSWYDQVPTISTERLMLRPFHEEDLYEIKQIYQDTSLYRFFGRNQNAIEKNPEYLFKPELYDARGVNILRWGIARKSDDKVVGEIMVYDIDGEQKCKVGCRIVRSEQGNGIATEATKKIVAFFREEEVFPIIQADVMKGNKASYHALSNSGFVRKGKMKRGRYYIYQYEDR